MAARGANKQDSPQGNCKIVFPGPRNNVLVTTFCTAEGMGGAARPAKKKLHKRAGKKGDSGDTVKSIRRKMLFYLLEGERVYGKLRTIYCSPAEEGCGRFMAARTARRRKHLPESIVMMV